MLFEQLLLLADPEPHSAALNMALDEVLLHTTTKPLLRCYRWARPAVSFGYFGKYAEVARAWPDRDLVRRWTGGGIVPHGEDFTYSLIVPRGCRFFARSAPDSYRAIHEAIATVLAPHDDRVALAGSAAGKVSNACFENPVRHDLVSAAQKIAGAAQRRTQCGLLHQGSIRFGNLPPLFPALLASAMSPTVEHCTLAAEQEQEATALTESRYAASTWLRRR